MSWNESDILVDKKSKFQGRCCSISTQEEIPRLLEKLVDENKNIQKATHQHMYAWRTSEVEGHDPSSIKGKRKASKNRVVLKNIQQGSSDCGEAGAGQRLLTLLERSNLTNIIVIVTRWYGGTALGPARFRHISSTAVESLRKGEFL